MVQATQAVGNDGDHWESEPHSQIGNGFRFRDGNQPSASAFDEDRVVFFREAAEPRFKRLQRYVAFFDLGCNERSGRRLKPNGIDFVERENVF